MHWARAQRLGQVLFAVLFVAAMSWTPVSAEDVRLSANVRAGGIDSRQREEAGSPIRRSRAVGLVAASLDKVTEAALDYGNYRRFMPHFKASRVLARRGSDAVVYIEVSALEGLATLWCEMKIRMLPQAGPTRVITARMVKGNLKGFQAEWQITPVESGKTLVAFELCADPDFPIPFANGIVSDYNEKEARKSVLALRKYVAKPSAIVAR